MSAETNRADLLVGIVVSAKERRVVRRLKQCSTGPTIKIAGLLVATVSSSRPRCLGTPVLGPHDEVDVEDHTFAC
jgi:hypothetical protein